MLRARIGKSNEDSIHFNKVKFVSAFSAIFKVNHDEDFSRVIQNREVFGFSSFYSAFLQRVREIVQRQNEI